VKNTLIIGAVVVGAYLLYRRSQAKTTTPNNVDRIKAWFTW